MSHYNRYDPNATVTVSIHTDPPEYDPSGPVSSLGYITVEVRMGTVYDAIHEAINQHRIDNYDGPEAVVLPEPYYRALRHYHGETPYIFGHRILNEKMLAKVEPTAERERAERLRQSAERSHRKADDIERAFGLA